MASLEIIMPPSTHCSAAMSCGGVRSTGGSKNAVGPGPAAPGALTSSVTDTRPPPVPLDGPSAPEPVCRPTSPARQADSAVAVLVTQLNYTYVIRGCDKNG